MATTTESTLYPKITTHVKDVVKTLKHKKRDPEHPEQEITLDPIVIRGTVKLHGTHADIVVHSDNTIVFQSRNQVNLLATADNGGFAAAMGKKTDTILALRDQYMARWAQLNPGQIPNSSEPVIIAGEWIGQGIQKDVGISRLSKRFVIVSTKINGQWVRDTDYENIEAYKDQIDNISRCGVYWRTLYPEDQQKTIDNLEELTEIVAARCPFAESFGIFGEGEGLVWKLEPYFSDADLWFKTKGGRFKPTFVPAPKKLADGAEEKREAAATVAKAWCSGQRLEQGWDILEENERNKKGIGKFLRWVQDDILLEEKGYIEEHQIEATLLKYEISAIAKPWYWERCQRAEE
ncbi:hypothetical protein BDV95DRAFT_586395 [Massariosphaeria phaeospora]|uniref:RNA ligase domain-containing protein n=1 Tax=Massariosphaeria phaeospora TaxID=100035 RepID=A0A7C8HYS9_9PLEO|nr:hypothetical protein BDV95DRAFT_586395 [Massariosphaeria phaeospora]